MTEPRTPAFSALRFEVSEGVATITLDQPEALNALNRALKSDLLGAFREAARDRAIRAVVLTGAGRGFCAGQDLRETTEPGAPSLATLIRDVYNPLVMRMRSLEKPVIAAVNGVAAGAGASLAFACDLRYAAEGASFLLAFGRVGLIPDTGATWFLPRLIGPARAAELMFTTEPLSASRAEQMGLVNRVVPADRLLDETRALALRLAEGAPTALALTKRALNRSLEVGLEDALAFEASLQGRGDGLGAAGDEPLH